MYAAAPLFTPRRSAPTGALAYQAAAVEIDVAGADPHRLVWLLLQGFDAAVADAQGALAQGDTERKCRAVARALRIVDEGLRAQLNLEAGGTLAQDLNGLYGWIVQRLSLANVRNDDALLAECRRLMRPVLEAWTEIGRRPERATFHVAR